LRYTPLMKIPATNDRVLVTTGQCHPTTRKARDHAIT
jgi:hypothetical protein